MTSSVMTADVYRVHAEVEATHWWFAGRRAIFDALASECLAAQQNPLVVDIGCSIGNNAALDVSGGRYVGVDPSPEAIRFAQEALPLERFICGTVGDEEVRGTVGEADFVMLTDVLEHVANDRDMLERAVAAMRHGSQLLVTVPADMSLWSKHDESHGHYRRYDRERFELLWQGLPVTPVMVSHFNSRLHPIIKLVRTINRWRGKSFGDADTDLKLPPRPVNWLLEKIFAGERKRLLAVLRGERKEGYRRGVSLIALLRREEDANVQAAMTNDQVPMANDQVPMTNDQGGASDCVLVVPCYNEAERLDVEAFRDFALQDAEVRFLFVNDGSTDRTGEVLDVLRESDAERFGVLHLERNVGKSEAVRQGML